MAACQGNDNTPQFTDATAPRGEFLFAWGDNGRGQLGLGDMTDRSVPTRVGGESTWAVAAAGDLHTLAVGSDGTLWAWGDQSQGRLGDGCTIFIECADSTSPIRIGTATNWSAVAAGFDFSVGLRSDGTLWVWGNNSGGELGLDDFPNFNNRIEPTRFGAATNWSAVVVGLNSILALKEDGTLWEWGRILPFGQIGTATNWTAIAIGGHTLALKSDGTLWAWGSNGAGQLGDGTTVEWTVPTQVCGDYDAENSNCLAAMNSVVSIAAGHAYSLAVKADGTLWAWGFNDFGQLGLGDFISRTTPARVGSAADWSTVATGGFTSLALKAEGTLWAWGGGLGNAASTPTQVGTASTVGKIAAGSGSFHSLVITLPAMP